MATPPTSAADVLSVTHQQSTSRNVHHSHLRVQPGSFTCQELFAGVPADLVVSIRRYVLQQHDPPLIQVPGLE